jgi:hypothetical protein
MVALGIDQHPGAPGEVQDQEAVELGNLETERVTIELPGHRDVIN